MGRVIAAYLMPHPPLAIPEVGGEETEKVKKTIEAMEECGKDIKERKPDTIVLITPHGPVFEDAVAICTLPEIKGDMEKFAAPHVTLSYRCNRELARDMMKRCQNKNIEAVSFDAGLCREYDIPLELDHGAFVPLYYIHPYYPSFRLVHITIGLLAYEELYDFGKAIQEAIHKSSDDVVIIASGDLSHRLTREAPAGFHPRSGELDECILENLRSFDFASMLKMDETLVEDGGECGLRPILIMMGALDGYPVSSRILSYEGPFGVGYGVGVFRVGVFSEQEQWSIKLHEDAKRTEDPYVKLARESLEEYVRTGSKRRLPRNLPDEMLRRRAGVFVSIKKQGRLRGCIGTMEPAYGNIAEEIMENAINAGIRDPRFAPIEQSELKQLVYSVDVLSPSEPIASMEQLDVKRYGVIVQKDRRAGLLLPNLQGVDKAEDQVAIALQKAGIDPEEDYTMERFEVIRHT